MKNFDEIKAYAKQRGPKTISVACAQDKEVLLAVEAARKEGIAKAILVGDEAKISEIAEELSELNELQKRIESKGVGCEHILKQGVSADIILNYAKEKNASYIVMGSHGRSGIYDVFVGSLTKDITKNSPIPVVVVPCHN